jgi:threonine synthase
MSTAYTLACVLCGSENDERRTTSYCLECGGVLDVRYEPSATPAPLPFLAPYPKDYLKTRPTETRRCAKLSAMFGAEIFAKLEYQNPTGSFKDRGSYVEVLKAIELQKAAICLASTGNMAASVSAYASFYGIPCYVFIPEHTSASKLTQSIIHGAKLIRVEGSYSDCEKLAAEFAEQYNYYLAGDYCFRVEGQKSFSYELYDEGLAESFDDVIVPVGCGTNLSAIAKGFRELREHGLISATPRMIAAQPTDSAPLIEGLRKGCKVRWDTVNTIAQAVAVGDPIDFDKVQTAITATNGCGYTATDEMILAALELQAREEAIFSEPSGALPLAVLIANTDHFVGRRVLLTITGNGLKDTLTLSRFMEQPSLLSNTWEAVAAYKASGIMENNASALSWNPKTNNRAF